MLNSHVAAIEDPSLDKSLCCAVLLQLAGMFEAVKAKR